MELNNEIHFERVVLAECTDLDSLFRRIDEVVLYIKNAINSLPTPLIWNFTWQIR